MASNSSHVSIDGSRCEDAVASKIQGRDDAAASKIPGRQLIGGDRRMQPGKSACARRFTQISLIVESDSLQLYWHGGTNADAVASKDGGHILSTTVIARGIVEGKTTQSGESLVFVVFPLKLQLAYDSNEVALFFN